MEQAFTRKNVSIIEYKERKGMEWLDNIGNSDSLICDIEIKDSCLVVYVKLWNEVIRQVKFMDYHMFKDKNSIGEEIGDISGNAFGTDEW